MYYKPISIAFFVSSVIVRKPIGVIRIRYRIGQKADTVRTSSGASERHRTMSALCRTISEDSRTHPNGIGLPPPHVGHCATQSEHRRTLSNGIGPCPSYVVVCVCVCALCAATRGGWNWSREIVNKLARYAIQACDHEVGASVSSSSLAVVALLHPD